MYKFFQYDSYKNNENDEDWRFLKNETSSGTWNYTKNKMAKLACICGIKNDWSTPDLPPDIQQKI